MDTSTDNADKFTAAAWMKCLTEQADRLRREITVAEVSTGCVALTDDAELSEGGEQIVLEAQELAAQAHALADQLDTLAKRFFTRVYGESAPDKATLSEPAA